MQGLLTLLGIVDSALLPSDFQPLVGVTWMRAFLSGASVFVLRKQDGGEGAAEWFLNRWTFRVGLGLIHPGEN